MKQAYRPEIDGLRAVAVVPVVLFHAGLETFAGGYVGVDVFFVISGYLITRLIIAELAEGRFSLAEFYERRARRILPALFLVVAATIPFALALMLPRQLEEFARTVVGVFAFVSNVVLWRQSGYFSLAAEEKPLLHTWSLSVEEQFYIIFPLVLIAIWRLGRRPVFALMAAGAALSLAIAEWGWRNEPAANFFLLPTRAWELLLGALCAMLPMTAVRRSRALGEGLGLLGLVMIAASIALFDAATPFPSLYALVPTVGTALVILFASADTVTGRLLALPPLVAIGLVSYSAYLWHQPVFAYLRIGFTGELTNAMVVGGTLLTFALAWPTWRFVEQPFRNRRTGPVRRRATVFAASGAMMVAFIAPAILVIAADGLPGRLTDAQRERMAALQTIQKERFEAIAAGRCHFNSNAEGADPTTFLDRWDCWPDDSGGTRPRVAVFGDSHAADKAHALRTAGFDVLQVTGNGCSVQPRLGGRPRCRQLMNAVLEFAGRAGVDTLVLTAQLQDNHLREDYLEATVDFWSERFERVVLISPMPEFFRFETLFVTAGLDGVAAIEAETGDIDRFIEITAALDMPDAVTVLDARSLVCPGGACRATAGGDVLVVDSAHLSRPGAERFGHNLSQALSGILAGPQPAAGPAPLLVETD